MILYKYTFVTLKEKFWYGRTGKYEEHILLLSTSWKSEHIYNHNQLIMTEYITILLFKVFTSVVLLVLHCFCCCNLLWNSTFSFLDMNITLQENEYNPTRKLFSIILKNRRILSTSRHHLLLHKLETLQQIWHLIMGNIQNFPMNVSPKLVFLQDI